MKTTLHKNILAVAIAIFTLGIANAQVTWTGATNTDFLTATNWDTGAVPTDGDHMIITNVTNDPVISTDLPGDYVTQITINDGASLTVSAKMWIRNTSDFGGTLTLNGSADVNIRNRAYFGTYADVTLNINRGSINSKSYFRLGNGSFNTVVNIDGGNLNSENTLFVGKYTGSGFSTIVNLNTGTININAIDFTNNRGVIKIDEGSLILSGDQVATINGFVTSDNVVTVSGKTINTSYDSETDKTTVTATETLSFNNNAEKVTVNITTANNQVNVSNITTATTINVYSVTGALVKNLNTNTDTSFSLPAGVWIATVKTAEGQKSVKLLCE